MSRPREDLGQHFLRAPDAIAYVIRAANIQPGEVVLDAGAGTGVLTLPLADAVGPTGRVHAVEVDRRMIRELQPHLPPNATIIEGDLLEVELPAGIDAVVANPPFKILAPLLERIVAARIPRAVLIVPGELAERLSAPPGSARYGPLTIRIGIMAEVVFTTTLSRRAFRPAPTVDCAVLAIRAREGATMPDEAALRAVIDAAKASWGRKTKYALALLPDAFRVDSAVFQKMLSDGGFADQTVSHLPPAAFAAIARHVAEHGRPPEPALIEEQAAANDDASGTQDSPQA